MVTNKLINTNYLNMILASRVPIRKVKITVTKYRCSRCEYEWFPRNLLKPGKPPHTCASCNNPFWNDDRQYDTKIVAKKFKEKV
jgi:hypothetical protein